MVDALRAAGAVDGCAVSVLGGGGTARAALGAAGELRAQRVTVYLRRPEAAEELRPVADALGLVMRVEPWSEAEACLADDLVVEYRAQGRGRSPCQRRVAGAPAQADRFRRGLRPVADAAGAATQRAGCTIVSGLDLLLAKGCVSSRCSPVSRPRWPRCAPPCSLRPPAVRFCAGGRRGLRRWRVTDWHPCCAG